jgi:nitroreductase
VGADAIFDVLASQRACRRFRPDPVPDGDLVRILEAATWAPSAENSQPWVFVVVRGGPTRDAIDDLARRLWYGGGRDHAASRLAEPLLDAVSGAIDRGFGGAPLVVVVGADTSRVHRRAVGASIYPAVQNLLVGATALGYGSALMTLPTMDRDALRALVGFPEEVEPMAVVPIGRPAAPLGRPRRDPIGTKAHDGFFGVPLAPRAPTD